MEENKNDKSLFEFNMKYTEKEYLNFNKFHVQCLRRYIHILVYACIFLVLSVSLYTDKSLWIKIISSIAPVLYTVWLLVYPVMYIKMKMKRKKININLIVNYVVYMEYFKVKTKFDEEFIKINYNDLYRAYETKKNFYLYINSSNAYIISKKKITGKISTFRSLLKLNLNKKFSRVI